MTICVVGLGKLGLPVATQFAAGGYRVLGADIDERTVELVNVGLEPFPGEEGLAERLTEAVRAGRLRASIDVAGCVARANVIVIAVPVVVDEQLEPDFRALDSVAEAIARGIRRDTLVILETTVPVGTTRERLARSISENSELEQGTDFLVAFSPERVLTGRVFEDLRKYPKIVGGINQASSEQAAAFYGSVLQFDERPDLAKENGVWDVGSCEAAELVKLVETTYRDVNIALANTFALYAEGQGIDINEVIAAANSQHYSHIHRPGIAVGGHCIPVYPHLYLAGDPKAYLVRAARSVNGDMPKRAVERLAKEIGDLKGLRVAILGASYRGGVKETAFSGVWPLVDVLLGHGARPVVHDPLYSDEELVSLGLEPYALGQPVDAVIIQTDHEAYRSLTIEDLPSARAVYDGRRILTPGNFPGSEVLLIGDGARA